ncbi:MAG: glycosyltransferase family 2 protein [Thermoguttaceae bacterium]
MGTDATVILCTHNRADRLAAVLADLGRMKVSPGTSWEIVVVDNCSTDHTKAVIEAAQSACAVPMRYHYEERKGKSHALNSAIQLARGEYLLFTDDDVRVDPGWLEAILDVFSRHPCIGMGGRIVPEWECPVPKWYSLEGPYRLMGAIVSFEQGDELCEAAAHPVGANMAFHRSVFDRYEGFRTDFGPYGRTPVAGEDTEFCERLMKSGERLLYVPTAVVKHPVDSQRASKSYFRSWYFHAGVGDVRCNGKPDGAVCYCGIPRYWIRNWLETSLLWFIGVDPKRRFYYEMRSRRALGTIIEYWRQRRNVKKGSPRSSGHLVETVS